MNKSIVMTAERMSLWLGVGRSKSYEKMGELKVYCNRSNNYSPTVWDFAAWQEWKPEYIWLNMYLTKEDIIKYLVNEILPKQTQTKYFGTLEIPFPKQ